MTSKVIDFKYDRCRCLKEKHRVEVLFIVEVLEAVCKGPGKNINLMFRKKWDPC